MGVTVGVGVGVDSGVGITVGVGVGVGSGVGVAVGVGIIAFVTGLGLGALINAAPILRMALMIIASGWILWMAWKLWNAEPLQANRAGQPFTFNQAVLFQWVNPKIWAISVAALVMVADMLPMAQAATLGVTFSATNLGVCLFWTYAGSLLRTLLNDPVKWRFFMRTMAVALAIFSGLVFL